MEILEGVFLMHCASLLCGVRNQPVVTHLHPRVLRRCRCRANLPIFWAITHTN